MYSSSECLIFPEVGDRQAKRVHLNQVIGNRIAKEKYEVRGIRKFNTRHFRIEDLVENGTLTNELGELLRDAVVQRRNILVSGGTGAGKTTLLNILADFIPDTNRILLIEDTAELNIRKDNLVRFEARREQGEIPSVTIRDLLKASLRHRPDRIIVGEIRGGEAFDLLQALNTGHSGTISTLHANSARQALSRFADCVLQSGVEVPHRAIRSNIGHSVDLLVHITRRRGKRVVSEVLEITSYDAGRDEYQITSLHDATI